MGKWSIFAGFAKLVIPSVVSAINPRLAPLGNTIADGIAEAQDMPGLSNADKLKHVQSLAHKAAVGINQATGKNTVPVDGLDAATEHVINTAVEITKLGHAKVVTNSPVE